MLGDQESVNRRTANRHTVSIPAQFVIFGDSQEGDASVDEGSEVTICNLSLGGAQLVFERRLSMGQRGMLTFNIPGHAKKVEIGTTVRWAADGYLGLQFAGLRALDVWAINRYLASINAASGDAAPQLADSGHP